jgi:hypothetical protein
LEEIVLRIFPKHWFTWNSEVLENDISIASIEFLAWGENGEIITHDCCYKVYREPGLSASFFLEENGKRIAWAIKPNPFYKLFEINYAGTEYELKAESPFLRQFILQERGLIIGAISPNHAFTRRAIAELPANIPLPIRLFMIWLVLLLWRRNEQASAVTSDAMST